MASFTPMSTAPSEDVSGDAHTDDEQAQVRGLPGSKGVSPASAGDAQQRGLTPAGPEEKLKKKPGSSSKKKTLPVRELTGANAFGGLRLVGCAAHFQETARAHWHPLCCDLCSRRKADSRVGAAALAWDRCAAVYAVRAWECVFRSECLGCVPRIDDVSLKLLDLAH